MESLESPITKDKDQVLARNDSGSMIETRYTRMLLESSDISWFNNFLADAANWVLLGGYLVVPGTFTSLQKLDALHKGLNKDEAGQAILNTIQHPLLLAITYSFFALAIAIMVWLFWELRNNYIWLMSRLFIPTFLNAVAGLLTTLINIYTARDGDWSVMALLIVIAAGLSTASSLALVIIYRLGKLKKVKKEHELETNADFRRISL